MKKRVLKTLCSKALAVTVGAAMMMQAYGPTFASAAEETQYISEVYLSYGKDDASAKKWLEDNGYTVVDQNLNEGAEGGGAVLSFIKIGSEKRSVYLGYKTTTDSKQAITDMRAMNMKGEYSYDEYEKVLESKKTEITNFIADMKSALAEYRANYKSGALKAKIAHDKMNLLLDDDCDNAPLGDLLLQPIKEEMKEEDYNKEPTKHADMTTLILQGNMGYVNNIMTDICYAADTAADNWVGRLEKSKGLDGLMERYESQYASFAESKLAAQQSAQ